MAAQPGAMGPRSCGRQHGGSLDLMKRRKYGQKPAEWGVVNACFGTVITGVSCGPEVSVRTLRTRRVAPGRAHARPLAGPEKQERRKPKPLKKRELPNKPNFCHSGPTCRAPGGSHTFTPSAPSPVTRFMPASSSICSEDSRHHHNNCPLARGRATSAGRLNIRTRWASVALR